jgi:TatD DNase family protein
MFIDAHCHLERATYGDEVDAVVARAQARGLTHFIAVGASGVTEGAHEALALATRLPQVYASVGIHPHEAKSADAEAMQTIAALLDRPRVVSLGEVGLDYYYDYSPRDVQRRVFGEFLTMAAAHDKPVMLHVRDAHEDCWKILDDVGLPRRGGVVHCFTGGPGEAEAYLSRGMYLSIPGVVTFKTAEALRDAVRQVPLDRLLLETDCPYLAPVPHRGKRNEPAYLVDTAAAVAALRDMSLEELGAHTHANTVRFYGLD